MSERAGVPSWDEIDIALRSWQQGDVAAISNFVHLAGPVGRPASEAADELSYTPIVTEITAVVILTQTCDLRYQSAKRPFLDVAPLVTLTPPTSDEARRGRRPAFASVPGAGETAFADLDRVMTIEKSALVGAKQTRGCPTTKELRDFGRAVARKHGRFAFPDDLTLSLVKFKDRLKEKHNKQGPEGRLLQVIDHIRVLAIPDWEEGAATSVTLILIFPTGYLPESDPDAPVDPTLIDWVRLDSPEPPDLAERFFQEHAAADKLFVLYALMDAWFELCEPQGTISEIAYELVGADELSIERAWATDSLDLDYLSES